MGTAGRSQLAAQARRRQRRATFDIWVPRLEADASEVLGDVQDGERVTERRGQEVSLGSARGRGLERAHRETRSPEPVDILLGTVGEEKGGAPVTT